MYSKKHGHLLKVLLTKWLNGMIFALISQHIYKIQSQMTAFLDYSVIAENLPR